jgi:hypothetical protein
MQQTHLSASLLVCNKWKVPLPFYFYKLKTKLRGPSPQANYTDRATAAVGDFYTDVKR